EALAGWLVAAGNGFTNDLRDGSFDPGLGAGARVVMGRGVFVSWVEASLAGWLRGQTAYATPGTASVALPRFEATLALGLSYRPGPCRAPSADNVVRFESPVSTHARAAVMSPSRSQFRVLAGRRPHDDEEDAHAPLDLASVYRRHADAVATWTRRLGGPDI